MNGNIYPGKTNKTRIDIISICVLFYDSGTPLPRSACSKYIYIYIESAQTRSIGTFIIIIAIIIIIIKTAMTKYVLIIIFYFLFHIYNNNNNILPAYNLIYSETYLFVLYIIII